jgi:hypothetical protein
MKLGELCKHIVTSALSVQYIVCRLADAQKSMFSMFKKLQQSAWKKDGDSHLDYTSHYSEMPGELKEYKNTQHEKAMKAPIKIYEDLDETLRKKGLL